MATSVAHRATGTRVRAGLPAWRTHRVHGSASTGFPVDGYGIGRQSTPASAPVPGFPTGSTEPWTRTCRRAGGIRRVLGCKADTAGRPSWSWTWPAAASIDTGLSIAASVEWTSVGAAASRRDVLQDHPDGQVGLLDAVDQRPASQGDAATDGVDARVRRDHLGPASPAAVRRSVPSRPGSGAGSRRRSCRCRATPSTSRSYASHQAGTRSDSVHGRSSDGRHPQPTSPCHG